MTATETGRITGTSDSEYDLIWYTEQCLKNALRLETCIGDAQRSGGNERADFFRKAQSGSREGAELGKQPLRSRLPA